MCNKTNAYDDIIKCLLSSKDKVGGSFSASFTYWVKKKFILMKIAGSDVGCCLTTKKPICVHI
jgi:hypothetical protein